MIQYLVRIHYDDGSITYRIMDADEIFSFMDMSDCHGAWIELWRLEDYPVPCVFHGIWHDFKDPLKMIIESGGAVLEVGYGTDH